MDIERLDTPVGLKKIEIGKLDQVAAQIRRRIMEVVSQKGGHLASSLGAVEICIALHYVLNTPKDKIVFDVGHQAYAHKLLTHRFKDFDKIREFGGISGFPFHKESVYDVFSVGHASNSISLATGLAVSNRLNKEKSKVVAVIGDGGLSGGECFEGLNNAGHRGEDLLVIFNHNEMSISPSVGALSNYLNKIISLPIYNRLREGMGLLLEKVPKIGKQMSPRMKKVEEIMKGIMIPGIFFEELGFRYFGPLDGHNLKNLIPTLRNIISLSGPKVLHLITQKGKGYIPAEKNPEKFHGAAPFIKNNGKDLSRKKYSYTNVFGESIKREAGKNKNIVALTAAMCKGTGLEEFKKEYPERFFDVAIAEQHLLSFSAGLCKNNLRPVVAIYSTFLQRAYDQLIEDIALQGLPVVFAIDRAGLVGEDGPTHHGVFDVGYLRNVPEMVVIAPGHKRDLEEALAFAVKHTHPVAIRYSKEESLVLSSEEAFCLSHSEVIRPGRDCAVLALGSMLKPAVKACGRLEKDGISVNLINPRFVKPLDEKMLLEIADTTPNIITLEEGVLDGGFGSAVLEFYERSGLLGKVNLHRIGLPSEFVTFGKRDELLKKFGLDSEGIYEKVKRFIKEQ